MTHLTHAIVSSVNFSSAAAPQLSVAAQSHQLTSLQPIIAAPAIRNPAVTDLRDPYQASPSSGLKGTVTASTAGEAPIILTFKLNRDASGSVTETSVVQQKNSAGQQNTAYVSEKRPLTMSLSALQAKPAEQTEIAEPGKRKRDHAPESDTQPVTTTTTVAKQLTEGDLNREQLLSQSRERIKQQKEEIASHIAKMNMSDDPKIPMNHQQVNALYQPITKRQYQLKAMKQPRVELSLQTEENLKAENDQLRYRLTQAEQQVKQLQELEATLAENMAVNMRQQAAKIAELEYQLQQAKQMLQSFIARPPMQMATVPVAHNYFPFQPVQPWRPSLPPQVTPFANVPFIQQAHQPQFFQGAPITTIVNQGGGFLRGNYFPAGQQNPQ